MVKQILIWIFEYSFEPQIIPITKTKDTYKHAAYTATVAIYAIKTMATLSMTSELAATQHVATDYSYIHSFNIIISCIVSFFTARSLDCSDWLAVQPTLISVGTSSFCFEDFYWYMTLFS